MNSQNKKALITGIAGQDGAYLSEFLLNKGYEVFGTVKTNSDPWRLKELNILEKITLFAPDPSSPTNFDLDYLIRQINPDEIYNLAGQSNVGVSFEKPVQTMEINGTGLLKIMDTVKNFNKEIKIFQASTGELYGNTNTSFQNEKTPFNPNSSPYALSKFFAHEFAKFYRETYGVFVSNGILFAHESPLRDLKFVTRKITTEIAKIKLGLSNELKLGDLSAERDWGYAKEYVECMWKILQHDVPEDFVIATGESHSVEEFVKESFDYAGLDWKKYVQVDNSLKRANRVPFLRGDPSKAKFKLGWEPKTKFKDVIKIMVDADLERCKTSP